MDKEITPLKDFDKSINYYQIIVKLEEYLVKVAQLKDIEYLKMLLNEIKAFIFSDETLKSIYLHNTELQCNKKYNSPEDENVEKELNYNALISYMKQAGYEFKGCYENNKVIVDYTNKYLNLIDDYFFPSFYKYIENKLEIDIKNLNIDSFKGFMYILDDILEPNLNLECFDFSNFDKIVFKELFEFDMLHSDLTYIDSDYSFFYYRTIINELLEILISTVKDNYCKKYYSFLSKDIEENTKKKNEELKRLLTPAQKDVINLTKKGYTEKEIAKKLNITEIAVKKRKELIVKTHLDVYNNYEDKIKPKEIIRMIEL